MLKKILLILYFFITYLSAIDGHPFIKNYTYLDYGGDNQVWGATQDKRGILYFVNSNVGVLEYDGVNWNHIKLSNRSSGRSIDVDKNGVVYVGGVGDFGYLKSYDNKTKFISLIEFIPKEERNFEYVWESVSVSDGVYFGTDRVIYRWFNGKINIIKTDSKFHIIRKVNDKAYVRVEGKGLMRIDEDKLTLISEKFANISVNALVPYDKNQILIFSREAGVFIYDGKNIKEFKTKADEFLRKNQIYDAIALKNEFVVATKNGAVILDKNGELKYILDNKTGLRDSFITHLFIDKEENVWLSLNNGIAKVEINSPFVIYDSLFGLDSSVNNMLREKNTLFVSTMKGVYKEDNIGFKKIDGIDINAWEMVAFKDFILVGTNEGIYEIKDSVKKLNITNESVLSIIKSNEKIYFSTPKSLKVMEFIDNKFEITKSFETNIQAWNLIAKDDEIWGSSEKGVIFRVNLKNEKVDFFDKKSGLEGGRFFISNIDGEILVSTTEGIYYFDNNKFIKELSLNLKDVGRVIKDKDGIWIRYEFTKLAFAKKENGEYSLEPTSFNRLNGYKFEVIYPEEQMVEGYKFEVIYPENNAIWFGGVEGLIKYNLNAKLLKSNYEVLIREIISNTKEININNKNFSYNKNSLTFKFSAPYFTSEELNEYQVFLNGYDKDYSNWSKNAFATYTNLSEGKYTFFVRAKNIYGVISNEAKFEFEINPPWYRTLFAYIFDVFLIVAFIYLIVLLQVRKAQKKSMLELKREQKHSQELETLVAKRTKELYELNQNLEKLVEEKVKQIRVQEDMLIQQSKMATMGEMIGNIAHQWKQPLNILSIIISSIEFEYEHDGEINNQKLLTKHLPEIIKQIEFMSNTVDDFKNFFKPNKEKENFLIKKAIEDTYSIISSDLRQKSIDFSIEGEDFNLFGYKNELKQVFLNILNNSKDAIFQNNTKEKFIKISLEKNKILIADSGGGIPQNVIENIFNPYFTTKKEGSGIGLYMSKSIVENMNGEISVENKNNGAEFKIEFKMEQKNE